MLQPQLVSYPVSNRQLNGYLAVPEGQGPFPGIVIIHEIFGLNENIKEVAERFASIGYIALAVDLFTGRNRTVCMFRAFTQLIFNSLENETIEDLKESLTFLKTQPNIAGEKIGVIGFCMGGSFALAWACTDERLKVAAPFYAMNPKPLEAVKRSCPIVGSYPGKDFTTGHAQKLDPALTEYNIPHEIKIYPDAKHSFFNDKGKNYNEAAATDSWNRVLSFFEAQFELNSAAN